MPFGIVAAMGKIFVTGRRPRKSLYDRSDTASGTVTTLTSSLGDYPLGIAFDGSRIWTANVGTSVSIVTLNPQR